jgi:hypothetical protein
MVRKRGLPDWAYYTIAVALTMFAQPLTALLIGDVYRMGRL